ncbi:serine/threonine-protein kinase [Streptomyces sp. CB02959]|uniref:serine/threonine-protein kinase n=1 Tax=Streptomyces sp. CB02959 TaxID=2020330 RepID=UPI0015E0BDB4|nr:serine/threonine-protein kinase [Streptomyces sp. CB02959]
MDDRYDLGALLGEGTMGQVWHARHLDLDRSVAVKTLRSGLLAGDLGGRQHEEMEEAIERFRREARLLARLDHPGIPKVYDARVRSGPGVSYIAMEFLLGENLEQVLSRRKLLPVMEVLSIGEALCDILEHTHDFPVIHRDIKPTNIMLTEDERVVLLDYGVAALFGAAHRRLTIGARVLGSFCYMAPEQFVQGSPVTVRSDLYSLACVLYELLVGAPPFEGAPAEVMDCHRHRTPPSPRLLRAEIPPVLDDLLLKALSKHQSNRPASARILRDRLTEIRWQLMELSPAQGSGRAQIPPPVVAPLRPQEALSVEARIGQAQALFDEGYLNAACLEFGMLAAELTADGQDPGDIVVECQAKAAYCRMRQGYEEEAAKSLRALMDLLLTTRPSDDDVLVEIRCYLGLALESMGQTNSAFEELAAPYSALTRRIGKDAALTVEVRSALNRIRRSL